METATPLQIQYAIFGQGDDLNRLKTLDAAGRG